MYKQDNEWCDQYDVKIEADCAMQELVKKPKQTVHSLTVNEQEPEENQKICKN